jgi:hypothetical protein
MRSGPESSDSRSVNVWSAAAFVRRFEEVHLRHVRARVLVRDVFDVAR